MNLFLSTPLSIEAIVRALSWTLLHSLWQGVLLSLLAGGIILATKKASPLLRYNLLASTLVLFISGVVVTFITLLIPAAPVVESTVMQVSSINIGELSTDLQTIKNTSSVTTQAVDFVNANASWIVLAWLLIIGYKFIRLSFGFYNIYQLKRRGVSSPGEYWNKKIAELCRQLRINKKVQLLQSRMVSIPVVIGYFKPVILFPAAMLTSMPVNEVEAILIHELGHIRRRDFLVNLLQNMVEIIFFFNPAILWVSSLIKTERENCCDDIAVTHTANKQDYIKALVTFQQFSLPATQQLATAFSGEENHLLNRVKRIIYNNNKTLNNMEKKFLSASLILVSVCLFAFVSNKTKDDKKMKSPILQPVHVSTAEVSKVAAHTQDIKKEKKIIFQPVSATSVETTNDLNVFAKMDSVPGYKLGGNTNLTGETNSFMDDGKRYRIVLKNSVVTELYNDGQKIPTEKITDYKTVLDKFYNQFIENREKAMRESEKAMVESEKAMKDSEKAMRDSEKTMRDSEQAMKHSEHAIKDSEVAMKDSEKAMKDSEQAIRDRVQAIKDREQAMKDREQAIKDREQAMRDREQSAKDRRMMNEILDDLIANNIIKDRKEIYSLKFNADELVVNDVKQPTALHKKFKNKYVTSSTWSWGIKQHK